MNLAEFGEFVCNKRNKDYESYDQLCFYPFFGDSGINIRLPFWRRVKYRELYAEVRSGIRICLKEIVDNRAWVVYVQELDRGGLYDIFLFQNMDDAQQEYLRQLVKYKFIVL